MMLGTLVVGFLVFARMAGLLMTLPGLASSSVPALARLGAAVPLAVVLYPAAGTPPLPATLPALLAAVVSEAFVGASMGVAVAMVHGCFAMAAEVIGMKMGFNLGMMLDPLTKAQQTPLATLAGWLATGLFVATNTHLRCISAVAHSLVVLPVGTIAHPLRAGAVMVDVVATIAVTSVQLAGPIVAFVFLVNLAMLMLGRMAPNLQLFFGIGASLTITAGLVILASALPALMVVYAETLATLPDWIGRIVTAVGGG